MIIFKSHVTFTIPERKARDLLTQLLFLTSSNITMITHVIVNSTTAPTTLPAITAVSSPNTIIVSIYCYWCDIGNNHFTLLFMNCISIRSYI